jgi:type IV secretory pathway VirB2 component (pilin)
VAVTDPNQGSSLLAAAQWLEGLVQGPLAVALAVIAVAATGLMMLSGRLAIRRGLVATLGCFVLFGAPAIARGFFASATSLAGSNELVVPKFETASPPLPAPQAGKPQIADPYAGASVDR